MKLGDAGFRDPEDLADLRKPHLLVVAQPEYEPLPFGQVQDGVGDALSQIGAVGVHDGVHRIRIGQRLEQGRLEAIGSARVPRLIQGDHARVRDAQQRGVQFLRVDRHLRGQLGVGRHPMQAGRQRGRCLLDLARLAADAPRHPVKRAQLVEDRAPDPRAGIRLEPDRRGRLEPLHGLDETTESV